jgi:hypothetical protein
VSASMRAPSPHRAALKCFMVAFTHLREGRWRLEPGMCVSWTGCRVFGARERACGKAWGIKTGLLNDRVNKRILSKAAKGGEGR